MAGAAGGPLAVRSWGANLFPCVREKVQQALAAWLIPLALDIPCPKFKQSLS